MDYCTIEDIETHTSTPTLIQLTSDDGQEEVDRVVAQEAILYSSTLIDGYLRGRYTLPLDTHFPLLRILAIDLSIYRLYTRRMRNEMPEVIENNYKNAIATLRDIQKAAQFLFLITRSFGGRGDTFGTVKKSCGGASKSQRNILTKIDAIHERLDKVMIENRDFEKLIKQYDFEDAFFYCDPPYTSGCGYEVTSTTDFDHERLRDVLKGIKGRFLLSYDDSPKVRELYKGYEMIEVERQNGINNREGTNRANKVYKELLIANYPIKDLFKNE